MKRLSPLVLLAAVSSTALAQATFHGNIARTGVYEGGGPTQAPGVKWTFKAAGPIVTSPAIADGVVYIASLSGHLYAIDAGNRPGEVELQVEPAHRLLACNRRRHGVLRLLGRIAGRDRRCDRAAEVGVCDRARAPVRGAGTARLPLSEADHSRRLGRLHVLARRRARQGVFRQRRRQRLRGRREERRAAVEVRDRRCRACLARRGRQHAFTSAAGTASSTRSTPRAASRSGCSRPG